MSPQSQIDITWTWVWLSVGALVFVLATGAFAYMLIRRRWEVLSPWFRHPLLGKMDRLLARWMPGLWRFIRQRFSIGEWHGFELTMSVLVVFGTGYAFLLIAEDWTSEEALYRIDQGIYAWLIGSVDDTFISIMAFVTHFADSTTIVVLAALTGIALLYSRQFWHVFALALAVGGGALLTLSLKLMFGRIRPFEQVTSAGGHSFPSGHSFGAVAFYGFLVFLIWRFASREGVRALGTAAIVLLIVLIGLSRVILRVHWVSDVMGGFAMGLLWLVCSLIATRAIREFSVAHRARRLREKAVPGADTTRPGTA